MQKKIPINLALQKAGRLAERVCRRSICATGLGPSDFAILETLLSQGPSQISQIGQNVNLASGSMTAAIDRLEKADYVRRSRDPADGRCCYVDLTPRGRNVIEGAYAEYEKNLERIAGRLTPEEQGDLVRLMGKLDRLEGE